MLAVLLLRQGEITKFINVHRVSLAFKSLRINDKVITVGLVFSN